MPGIQHRYTRFRSVCSNWRSSFLPKPCPLPSHFALPRLDSPNTYAFSLSRHTIFLVTIPDHSHNNPASALDSYCCLVKIKEEEHNRTMLLDPFLVKIKDEEHNRMMLLNPFSTSELEQLPINFPNVLNLLNFRVIELAHEYVVNYLTDRYHMLGDYPASRTRNAAFMCSSTKNEYYVLYVTAFDGKLTFFSSKDKQLTVIEGSPLRCRAVIHFKGKFYAVNEMGQTISFEPSSNASLFADVGSYAYERRLVESAGELFFVDKFPNIEIDRPTHEFKIFKFSEEEQKWDQVLFWGRQGAFSISVSKLCGCRGNCIIFYKESYFFIVGEDGKQIDGGISVLDLKDGRIKPLNDFPGCIKLLLYPPDWVISQRQIVVSPQTPRKEQG